MKNYYYKNKKSGGSMKNLLTILIILSLVSPVSAGQKIKDMSMSVEETNQLLKNPPANPNTAVNNGFSNGINAGTGFDDSVPLDPNMAKQMREINARNAAAENQNYLGGPSALPLSSSQGAAIPLPPPRRGSASQQNYIGQFCSSSYAASNSGSPAMQTCQEDQRQQSCERFTRATVNVQRILSQAIDCELNDTGYNASGCDGLDASRLDLLKQYWQDEDISYTILFLPDMVLNTAANCANKR